MRIDIAPGGSASPRATRFLVTDDRRLQYSMDGEDLRTACNFSAPKDAPRLFSSFFKPVNNPDAIQFVEGHGLGHGVDVPVVCRSTGREGAAL